MSLIVYSIIKGVHRYKNSHYKIYIICMSMCQSGSLVINPLRNIFFSQWNHQGCFNCINDQLRSGSYGISHLLVMEILHPITAFA
jgi:hypothetical protein